MASVKQWLEERGLGKYWKIFEEEEIHFEDLPHLTDDNLEQLGLPVGPRARLLVAIAELVSASASHPANSESSRSGAASHQRRAERRQITVLFCDLVDSTRLANRLDPEDYESIMQAYQETCRKVIEDHGGHIRQFLGDGVMAYFGWPSALEDAAERAVRAGMDTLHSVQQIPGDSRLAARVGISTGIVVISDVSAGDGAIPSGAIGDTPHIAARLQSLAAPNEVIISESTSRLVSNRFEQKDLGLQQLKGILEDIRAFRVVGVQESASRFGNTGARRLTPLVGRRTEIALLTDRWRDVEFGEGQVVFISGVPGIGKSRLVYELEQAIIGDPHTTLHFQCLPHCTQSAFFPVIRQFERLAEIRSDESEHVKLEKLNALLLKATGKPERALTLVAELLSTFEKPRNESQGAVVARKAQTLSALADLVIELSARAPVLCVLEDAQWIDPSTQELLDLIVERIEKSRVLLAVTCRPDYVPGVGEGGNVSALTISRLNRREVTELAQICLKYPNASDEVVNRVVEDSDAIPLFVEELAQGVVNRDRALERAPGENVPGAKTAGSRVPESLRDSLMARLDRVPAARGVAQLAAVIGREFPRELLLSLTPLNSMELDAALSQLEEGEIVRRLDNRPPLRYVFKHALVRDAAYDSLLKSSRRKAHSELGIELETAKWRELAETQPELLAYHFGAAGNSGKALEYWVKGGNRARDRSANLEAMGQYQASIEYLPMIPPSRDRDVQELGILLSLGRCLVAVRGYSADETRQAFERASILGEHLQETVQELRAIYGLWGHYWMVASHDRAIELAEILLDRAKRAGDKGAEVVGHRALGSTLFTLGKLEQARGHLLTSIELAQQGQGKKLGAFYTVDPRIAAQLVLAWNVWIMGYPAQALQHVLEALDTAMAHGDPYGEAFARYVTSAILLFRGEFRESLQYADQSLALSVDHKIRLYALYSRFGRGCALAGTGEAAKAILDIRQGIEEARQSNLGYMRAFMLACLATVQHEAGDTETALGTIDDAMKCTDDVSGRAWEAEVHRVRGELLLARGPFGAVDAEEEFREALSVSRRQQAHSLELRAATSLASLLRGLDRCEEARTVLSAAFNWFTEGLETADLQRAQALLQELGGTAKR